MNNRYPFLIYLVFQLVLLGCISNEENVIAFKNGQWFNGQDFERKSLYSVDGVFQEAYSKSPDTIIDLKDGYVVPPFGDAHTHNLADPEEVDPLLNKYMQQGVFYVQVLTNYTSKADSLSMRFATPQTIDVKYANGGLTSTLGHPHLAYETSALGLHWSAIFSQRDRIKNSRIAENDAYWFLDNTKDVEQKWGDILATNPDLIKIYLINTDQHQMLLEAEQMGKFGLSEEVARLVVRKSHEAGLQVYAHVENAYDFRFGLNIGVDGFAHLPGYSWDGVQNVDIYRLNDEDITQARANNTVIIPTVNFAKIYAMRYDNRGNASLDSLRLETVNKFLRDELNRLHKADVKLALGADQNGETSIIEAAYLINDLEVFNEVTTLKLLSETTPQTIYPDRKLGKLEEGYEASFLVLNGNPLDNWDNLSTINLYVKQGHILNVK